MAAGDGQTNDAGRQATCRYESGLYWCNGSGRLYTGRSERTGEWVGPCPACVPMLNLGCLTCGHWKVGQFTKEDVADWFRIHPAARVRTGRGPERASTCPHPCGTPAPAASQGDGS